MVKTITSQTILRSLEQHRSELQKYKVKRLGLFGSYLTKKQHAKSDIDLLVHLENPTFDNYMDLKFRLEKMFHRKVDLVMEEDLKSALQSVKKEAHYVKGL